MSRVIENDKNFGIEINPEVYSKDFDDVGFEPVEDGSTYTGQYEDD